MESQRELLYQSTLQAILDFEAQCDRKRRYTESEKMRRVYETVHNGLMQRINKQKNVYEKSNVISAQQLNYVY